MKDAKDLIIRVVDSAGGLFFPVAQRLARDAKLVEYWTPAWEAMPTARCCSIGDGFQEVQRVNYPFSKSNNPDLFVFPDLDFAEMQQDALDRGYPVWGNRNAEELENKRGLFLKMLKSVGLPVPEHKTIIGIEALTDYLKDNDDKYVKVSKYRGDWETLHWRSWKQDKTELYLRSLRLGPFGDQMTFYVFEPIDAIIEDGIDSFAIDGQWPETCLHGVEKKNKGYFCTVAKFSELPDELRMVNEALSPALSSYGARGDVSTEVRITEGGDSFFIDPTIRKGVPPSQVTTEMFSNYTEYHYAGALGELVEPQPAAQFGIQVLLHSNASNDAYTEIEIPDSLKQWVKISGCTELNGRVCVGPSKDSGRDIGWLCATGDTPKEVVKNLMGYIEQLPEGVEADPYSVAELLKEIANAEDSGIEFSDLEMPEPEIVLADK